MRLSWGTIGHLRWGRRGKKEKEEERKKKRGKKERKEEIRSLEASLCCCGHYLTPPFCTDIKKKYFYITWFPIRCEHKGVCSNPDTAHHLNVEIVFFFRIIYEMHRSIHLSLLFQFCFLLIMNLLGFARSDLNNSHTIKSDCKYL